MENRTCQIISICSLKLFVERQIYFTITARRDGSSYFAENNKWGIFPSASVAWRVNEEVFMKDKTPFSDLKLRIGYGAVGNENVLGSNALSLYTSDTNYKYLIGNVMSTALLLTQIEIRT